ncbi:MAG TPA: hypothetical protein VFV78_01140 [Vicinamibacterales bacterium]|nr:hypothetical protein [Vicinamibacterales bacterium]
MKLPLPHNPLSIAGAFLATIGALFFLIFFLLELFGLHSNPYMGIVVYFLLPAVFVLGLLLIPLGIWRDRRRQRAGAERVWRKIDFNNPQHRNIAFLIAAATFANVLIVSLAAYSGIHYMDTDQFCGQVCHAVMEPEFSAHMEGPHSRVGCVECHIGPGAAGFARAKLSGLRQLVGVTLGNYSRPISTPFHTMPSPKDICEGCHWPEKFHGDVEKAIKEYASDETNTESTTTLLLHVGGGSEKLSIASGIHWHMNIANVVEYVATDDKRQVIPWVKVTDRQGNTRTYVTEGVTQAEIDKGERRTMNCLDCHNRPSHTFEPSADKAVNRALATGLIPRDLPFVKREVTAALSETYPSRQAADEKIAQRLREFYRTNYNAISTGRSQDVERAISGATLLYGRNVFPQMKITWGMYPNNIGHMDFPGCFRCHDDSHKTTDGKAIGQDCALCHEMK